MKASWSKCERYTRFKKHENSYNSDKTVLPSCCNKCGNHDNKIFKEKESIEV